MIKPEFTPFIISCNPLWVWVLDYLVVNLILFAMILQLAHDLYSSSSRAIPRAWRITFRAVTP